MTHNDVADAREAEWLREAMREVDAIAPETQPLAPKQATGTRRRHVFTQFIKDYGLSFSLVTLLIGIGFLTYGTLTRNRTFRVVDKGVFTVTRELAIGRVRAENEYDVFGANNGFGVPTCALSPAAYSAIAIGSVVTCLSTIR